MAESVYYVRAYVQCSLRCQQSVVHGSSHHTEGRIGEVQRFSGPANTWPSYCPK